MGSCDSKHPQSNTCRICLITEPKIYLLKLCDCKTMIHVDCFNKWFTAQDESNHKKCEICNKKYKLNEKNYGIFGLGSKPIQDERIYFPSNDVCPIPLFSRLSLKKYTGMSRLQMAINYLQTDRVRELLLEPEILEALPTYFQNYEGYKQTPLIALCTGNIGDNYMIHLGCNQVNYFEIINMLLATKKIDLKHKDAFGRTAIDYAKENNIGSWLDDLI
jgi:hypothetical protein